MLLRKKTQSLLAFCLAIIMIISLTACESESNKALQNSAKESINSEDSSGSKAQTKDPVTLTIKWYDAFKDFGVQKDPVSDEIQKRIGVTMDIQSCDDDKFKLQLASGDIADICVTKPNFVKQMIEGKLAIPMDDFIKSNGQNLELVPIRLDYSRRKLSNGENKVYFLPCNACQPPLTPLADTPAYEEGISFFTRWDYYKELGYPEIKDPFEYLNVLEQMVKKHPTTEDGKKVYGISAWNDWGLWPFFIQFSIPFSYWNVNPYYLWGDKDDFRNMLTDDDNGCFWQGVKWYNKAYRMGLVDPDLFINKFDNYMAKAKAGQVLTAYADWQKPELNAALGQGKGFEPIPGVTPYQCVVGQQQPSFGWPDKLICISSKCKTPERAMDFINFCFGYEGSRLIASGVKGVHWDIENGKPELKDEIYKSMEQDSEFSKTTGIKRYEHLQGLAGMVLDPQDKGPMDLKRTVKGNKKMLTDLDTDYCNHYNVSFPGEIFKKYVEEGKMKINNRGGLVASPVPDDDTKKIDAKVEEYAKTAIPKLVMAKSDEEFNAEVKKFREGIKTLGVDKATEYWVKEFNKAKEEASSYIK